MNIIVKIKLLIINIKMRIAIIRYSKKQSKKVYKETKAMLLDLFIKKQKST